MYAKKKSFKKIPCPTTMRAIILPSSFCWQKYRNTKYIYPKLRNNCSKLRNKHENHFNLYNIAINLTKNIKKWKQIQCIENIENTKKTKKCKISIFNIFSII